MSDNSFESFETVTDIPLPFGDPSEEDKLLMDKAYNEASVMPHKTEVCDCPLCKEEGREGGIIYESESNFYCTNATKRMNKICDFILYKNNIERLIRRDICSEDVIKLCEDGYFETTCTKIGGDKKYKGTFVAERRDGKHYISLRLTFPEKAGEKHEVHD